MDEAKVEGAEEVVPAAPAEDVVSEPIVETPAEEEVPAEVPAAVEEEDEEEVVAEPEDEPADDGAGSEVAEPTPAEPAPEAV